MLKHLSKVQGEKIVKIVKLEKTASGASVSYTGAVLSDSIRSNGQIIPSKEILKRFNIPQGWTPVANHMTINIGAAKEQAKELLGNEIELNIVAVAQDENVMAAQVATGMATDSAIPHITLAINPQTAATPAMSNNLKIWDRITPFSIAGIVKEVKTDGFLLTEEDKQQAEADEQRMIEERTQKEKEKSKNSPTNIIKERGLNREQAEEFLGTETKIPPQAWPNILNAAGL